MKEHNEFTHNADQEAREDTVLERLTLDNGNVLELYSDRENDLVRRYYIKNQEGKIVTFGDPEHYKNPSQEDIRLLRIYLASQHSFLADEDIKHILQVIREREFHQLYGEGDTAH